MTFSHLLDTNTVSIAARAESLSLDERLATFAPGALCISAITEGEILYGLAKSPAATRIARAMGAMLARLAVLPWTSETAAAYGQLRAEMRRQGRALPRSTC